MVTAKQIDDKRITVIEYLQILDQIKRKMHTDVYRATSSALAAQLSMDEVYVDFEHKCVREEFQDDFLTFMIETCRFKERDAIRLNNYKLRLNGLVDQKLNNKFYSDNFNLFSTAGKILHNIGNAAYSMNDRFKKKEE